MKKLIFTTAVVFATALSWQASAATPAAAAKSTAASPALLAEIQRLLTQSGMDNAQIGSLMASLRSMSMDQVRGLADARNVSQLERLMPGASSAQAKAGRDPSQASFGTAGTGGSASQNTFTNMQNRGPGDMVGSRTSQQSSCNACPDGGGTSGGNAGNVHDDTSGDRAPFTDSNGNTITIYRDGSAKITGRDGKSEYLNSENRIVNSRGGAVTPNPESNASSGRVTAQQMKELMIRQGRLSKPTGENNGGTGGPISTTKSDPTGTVGLFTDTRGKTASVSVDAVREIIRIAVEKTGGPIGR